MYLVIGLGNPGQHYTKNRHNIGFRLVDYLADKYNISLKRNECRCAVGTGKIGDEEVLLAKPKTYMNNSGVAVSRLLQKFSVIPAQIIVLYDDLDLPLGQLRVRSRGSAGGHKGIKSIIAEIGTSDFKRIKIGIGRPDAGKTERALEEEIVSYVLSDFTTAEEEKVNTVIATAADALQNLLQESIQSAMNKFNKSGGPV